jgi:acetylornithine deacetylase/succinyl-diaminopimelate desuccinylase family protein
MNEEQVTQLLQDLVRIPSVNPAGDPGTAAKNTGEARIVEYLADFFRKLALDVETQEVEPGRVNIIGKFSSRGARRSIALAPHTDTVSVAGMSIDPFGGVVREGRLYGRGSTDTKGSMAAMLAALANVVRRKDFREGDLDVYFCGLMGEESGNDGARALVQRGFKVDYAIAGEPTDCRIVHTHKGTLWFKIITRGRSVHASMPEKGESAIGRMAEVVQWLLGDYAQSLRAKPHPVLGPPTVNVGTIRGGSQTNIVPDYCEIDVDRRMVPGETNEAVLAELKEKLKRLGIETVMGRDCVPLYTDPANPFVQQLAAATGLGKEALVGAAWFCDAALFAEKGTPAVAFGPGNVAQAHTADEFIELKEAFRAARILEAFLLLPAP